MPLLLKDVGRGRHNLGGVSLDAFARGYYCDAADSTTAHNSRIAPAAWLDSLPHPSAQHPPQASPLEDTTIRARSKAGRTFHVRGRLVARTATLRALRTWPMRPKGTQRKGRAHKLVDSTMRWVQRQSCMRPPWSPTRIAA